MAIQNRYGFFRDAKLTTDGSIMVTSPLSIADGSITTQSHINKFGRNYDIDSGTVPETVWSKGGIYIPPTQSRIHTLVSDSIQDSAILNYTGSITNFNILSNGNIEIIDSSATFITTGILSGDKFINDTSLDHTIIVSVDSETQITIQPLHDNGNTTINDSFRIITSNGTGASVVHIFGLDADCNEQKEFVILNGTTPVSTLNSYLRINRCHTDLTGSNGTNVGNIDVVADVDLTSTAYISSGDGSTLQAFYTVPNGKTAYMTSINFSSHRIGSTSNAMISTTLRETKFIPEGSIKVIEDTISVSLVGTSFTQKEYNPYKVFKQRTDIWLQVEYVTDNNMNVSGGFDIILKDNNK